MEKNPEFDDIRPFYDDEVAPAIGRLLNDSQFREGMNRLFQEKDREQIEQLMRTLTNLLDFQHFIESTVNKVLNQTTTDVTGGGLENVSKSTAYTYVSNHRDIIWDVALLVVFLLGNGYETTVEIAMGDNLLLTDWIKDMVRLNKSFIVKRNLPIRQIHEASVHLSKYIHFTILNKKQSIWIAQREGRAKDSNDRTQESLLKMLAMGSDRNFLESLSEINLTPTTFSYEYDPCDFLKAKEFQQKRDNPDFKKTQDDDSLNMQTGLFGYKGRVHLQIGRPINPLLAELDRSLKINELAKKVAAIIDKEIFLNYKFFPINYITYDRLWGKNFFREQYTADDIKNVDRYFQQQTDKIDLPNKDISYLTGKLEEMYAYPVKNFLSVSSE